MAKPFDYLPELTDHVVRLRPMVPNDVDPLHAVASDPLIWEQHTQTDRHERDIFRRFCDDALAGTGALVIEDAATGAMIGSSRFHGHDADASEVEIGWTFLARSHWGGATNARVKRLMLDHAFRWVDRVVLLIAPSNLRSQGAARKIGARLEGERPNARGEPSLVFAVARPFAVDRPV